MHANNPQLRVLRALKDLLTFWAPALLRLGYCVRQCYWEGRPGQSTTGVTAQRILQTCLVMHAHLLDDWDAREEYTRTMATALLVWLPWHSHLPGCMFVEEACEAMLSRVVARCRQQRQLTGFQATYNLFVTLPRPHLQGARGEVVRADLVGLFIRRLRAMISMPDRVMYPRISVGNDGLWEASLPVTAIFPRPMAAEADREQWVRLFQSVLALVTGPYREVRGIVAALQGHVHPVTGQESVLRSGFLERTARWRSERLRRMAADRRPLQRPTPSQPAQRPPAPVHGAPAQAMPAPCVSAQPPPVQPAQAPEEASSSAGSLYEPPDSPPMSPGVESDLESEGWCSLGELEPFEAPEVPSSPSAACTEGEEAASQ